MTNTELILNMLAGTSTKDISKAMNPETFEESKKVLNKVEMLPKLRLKNLNPKLEKR